MFLRKKRKVAGGESYDYWSLCETVRTAKGPRQRVVAGLGKLDEEDIGSGGWEDIESLPSGKRGARSRQLEFGEAGAQPPAPCWEKVDVGAVRVERVREFGQVYLPLALWHRLGLGKLLGELMEPGREAVGWPTVASVLVAARFCAQRSELGIAEGWYEKSALEDLLGVEKERINEDRLYRGLDVLARNKEKLCAHLIERYRDWFGVRMEFLLYDVTSTFFEGRAEKNPKAARGYSRDSRPDRKQVCIGLVCTPEGLPLSYEVFSGNRADVTTVEDIVKMMEEKYGAAERVWVMDRGMVSEANIAFLRARKALYIVGTPKSELRRFEAALLEAENWTQVQDGLEARMVEHPDDNGAEKYVLCRSTARASDPSPRRTRHRRPGLRSLLLQSSGSRRASPPAARSLPAAHQLPGNRPRHPLALVYPAHRRRGRVPHGQERSGPAPDLPPPPIPSGCPHPGLLPRPGSLANPRAVDGLQGPRLLCPQTHRLHLHDQKHGCHPPDRTIRPAHRPATARGRQTRKRHRPAPRPPRPSDPAPIQNYRKCSAENRLTIPANTHGCDIGSFKLRNLG